MLPKFSNKQLNFPGDYLNHEFVDGAEETDVQVAAAKKVIERASKKRKAAN
jgi:hypothetical protein